LANKGLKVLKEELEAIIKKNEDAREEWFKSKIGTRGFLWRKLTRKNLKTEADMVFRYDWIDTHFAEKRVKRMEHLIGRLELMDGEFRVNLSDEDMDLLTWGG
jgi:hypothetical protein